MSENTSKFLSLILRHKPETIGINLDNNGWTDVQELLIKMNASGQSLTLEQLITLVDTNDKKRFVFSPDQSKIRANQGHSVSVDLELKELTPPKQLYHGTAIKNIDSIKEKGLIKGDRHHVHLSSDPETARKVGMRYGKPIVLIINSEYMYSDGYKFYLSDNGVWLTDKVLPGYIIFE